MQTCHTAENYRVISDIIYFAEADYDIWFLYMFHCYIAAAESLSLNDDDAI